MSNILSNQKRLKKRYRADLRLRIYGITAIAISFLFLGILLTSIVSKGYTAFWQTTIQLNVTFSANTIFQNNQLSTRNSNYTKLIQNALKAQFPEATTRKDLFQLYDLVSKNASRQIMEKATENPDIVGKTIPIWVTASSLVDMVEKGKISITAPEEQRKVKNNQLQWITTLKENGQLKKVFNCTFFTASDSREADQAGILGGMIGSIFTIIVCLLFSFPLAVLTAVYLEEFAPKNRLTDIIEVNINNLAAVPSIVFGLLGLAVYLGIAGMPRSSSLAGGLTLALMILPTIVITTRHALKAVPPSIREGVMALGASPLQTTLHHTIPLAIPGIMTGVILAISRALGETAPLLMIGMVAFVADVPHDFLDPATVLPVQIYLWADTPELAFVEKTSAAIMVLVAGLIMMNALAVFLRKKYEYRW